MTSPFAGLAPRIALPATAKAAVLRGVLNKCPRCNEAKLFVRYLKPDPCCPHCGHDWTRHKADDFPPYISIFITGHIMAPVIIELGSRDTWPLWLQLLLGFAIAAVLMIGLLQPAKGATIALQWWLGMHGFQPGGRDEVGRVEVGQGRPSGG